MTVHRCDTCVFCSFVDKTLLFLSELHEYTTRILNIAVKTEEKIFITSLYYLLIQVFLSMIDVVMIYVIRVFAHILIQIRRFYDIPMSFDKLLNKSQHKKLSHQNFTRITYEHGASLERGFRFCLPILLEIQSAGCLSWGVVS
jgi:hypothetical protein